MAEKKVILAEPRGFCAGVRRAISMVEQALDHYGPPVYVRKEIVHNHHVIRALEKRGAVFTSTEEEVPEGAVCVFSAHGVSPAVRGNAAARELHVLDATCPLVSKVHQEARRYARDGRTILLIGHSDHEEVEGTYGEAPASTIVVESVQDAEELELPPDASPVYLTQTTLSLDETADIVGTLRDRFPALAGPASEDICYASQNRQNAIKKIAAHAELVLVLGSANSSNSVRMVEVARGAGADAHLLPNVEDLDPAWLTGVTSVGVSAGASTPEFLVDRLVDRLVEHGYDGLEIEHAATENITFTFRPAWHTEEANTEEANPGQANTEEANIEEGAHA
ncbi:4-hydroxy-3-methylbut-2-enyl diphosphate reductase [Sphaerisporangium sp. B11E5]|uniref:4-hydroxy-3-methylbut-2-enyl diphosphate reductase n=1 Tax=Sphaerisporangium sp. B11E5 TaxID=3153563 RepID=UPI00325E6DA3